MATVGFREVRPLGTAGKIFTIVLIVIGVGTVLYNLGVVLEIITEGQLRQHLERRRMDARIAALRGHVIVCGYGRVGRAATDFLASAGHEPVVVESDATRLVDLPAGVAHLVGDVTEDRVLRGAGLEHARAVVVALDNDADTVYATLSARAMRPDVVIVARARTTDSKAKLRLAGATRAVNPQRIGGRRLAVFALQPHVAEFFDVVMHDENVDWRVEQVRVVAGSEVAGRSLAELRIRARTGALLLAVRRSDGDVLEPNPPDELVVPAGAVLIALGTQPELGALSTIGGLSTMAGHARAD